MFSGIIEITGGVTRIGQAEGQQVVTIRKPAGWKLKDGESVSVEGVCSTVQSSNAREFRIVYMPETLRRSTLGSLRTGSYVNLERSLRLNSLMGGHLVQGHVDCTGKIRAVKPEGEARIYEFEIPARYMRYVVEKGSIAIDGVSLTVVETRRSRFTVSLLAYTLARTTLGGKKAGDRVNIEVDMVAKYLERLAAR